MQFLGALKFLYRVTLQRPDVVASIPWPRKPRGRPDVMTRDEVRRVIEATRLPYWRTFFATAYSTGARRFEVANLRVQDIDADSGLLHIVRGKVESRARSCSTRPFLLPCGGTGAPSAL